MKIWHLIISYLFSATFWIFTVGMFEDYFCIPTLIAIVTPLSFMLFKDEKHYNKFYYRGAQCIIASFFVALIGFFSFLGYTRGEFSNSLVAITDNIETATKIENILFEKQRSQFYHPRAIFSVNWWHNTPFGEPRGARLPTKHHQPLVA